MYFSNASCSALCSACVSSGSRCLSGRTSTTWESGSPLPRATGSSGTFFSCHCALDFSQKICAVTLPSLAEANRYPDTIALASTTPRSRSSRHCLRSVLGAQPMILAMSSCRTPTPAKWRTFLRTASLTTKAFLAMARASIRVLARGALVEGLTRCLVYSGAPGKGLPASHDDIDISGAQLETAAAAAGHFGRDQARARTEKRVIDQLAGPAVVDDRAAHRLDRLLRAVAPTLLALRAAERIVVGEFPDRCLRAVAGPVA